MDIILGMGVKVKRSRDSDNRRMPPPERSNVGFRDELPRLLAERGMSLRALEREVGVTSGHLSRVLRGVDYKTASGDLTRRVAEVLCLQPDYFPEAREAFIVEAIRRNPAVRDRLYDQLRRRS
jgi:transcriptional regulator with XRE-family HTH domain